MNYKESTNKETNPEVMKKERVLTQRVINFEDLGYNLNNDKCTKNIIKYRYSERSCVGGSIDYKWSDSENDEALLKQGYVLTGVKEQRNSK